MLQMCNILEKASNLCFLKQSNNDITSDICISMRTSYCFCSVSESSIGFFAIHEYFYFLKIKIIFLHDYINIYNVLNIY